MAAVFQAVVIVLLAAVAGAASFRLHPKAPALYAVEAPVRDDEVTLEKVRDNWQGKVIWLDARPKDQFEKEHVPGAHLLNEQDFDHQLLEILEVLQEADRPVIIYCGGERCEASRKVREKLVQMVPLDQCYELKGGWPVWKAAQPASGR
jgi:rhodanese-related sulfurtransferase